MTLTSSSCGLVDCHFAINQHSKRLVTMKTILYLNTILSMVLMLLALWSFGHREITDIQFLLVTLFSVFTGVVSMYEAEVNA